ncbi:uncharacterized protein TNCV_201361 [Trichonephila clavipes]|nr:uncharacterized protein TNCV_201361 [Trichonephila clavipes]
MTPELAPPLLTTTTHQREDVSALDRFNEHRCPTRWVFSGTGFELATRQATIRYPYHSATAATKMPPYAKLVRTATAGSDVVQSGRPIFDDFFQHLWPYIGNNTANVVFQMDNLWTMSSNLVLGLFDESTPCLMIVLMNCQTKLRINHLTAVKSVAILEMHFWLNGYVSKQNCRFWSEANPQVYVETPLHPEKLTVWCALWAGGTLLQKR